MGKSIQKIFFKSNSSIDALSKSLAPFCNLNTVIVCIGTDKCIGDCLGPLIGTLLKKNNFPLPIYGTLSSPIHALNIEEKIKTIKKRHPHSFIIAVDACLGDSDKIGDIEIRIGPIYPGKGIGKKLPPVGDLSIVGIVDSTDNDTSFSLHNIRLSFVMEMAEVISEGLMKAATSI